MTVPPASSPLPDIGSPLSPVQADMDSWVVSGNGNTSGEGNGYLGVNAGNSVCSGGGGGNGSLPVGSNTIAHSSHISAVGHSSHASDILPSSFITSGSQLPKLPLSASGPLPPPPSAGSISLITSSSPIQAQQQANAPQSAQHSYGASQTQAHQQTVSAYGSHGTAQPQPLSTGADYHATWTDLSQGSPTNIAGVGSSSNIGAVSSSQTGPYFRGASATGGSLTATTLPVQQHVPSISPHSALPSHVAFNQYGQPQPESFAGVDYSAQQVSQPSLQMYAQQSHLASSASLKLHHQPQSGAHYHDGSRFERPQGLQPTDAHTHQLTQPQSPYFHHSQSQYQLQQQSHPAQLSVRQDQQHFPDQFSDQAHQQFQHGLHQESYSDQSQAQIRLQQGARSAQQYPHFHGQPMNGGHSVDFGVSDPAVPDSLLAPLLSMSGAQPGASGSAEDGSGYPMSRHECDICGETFRQKRARDTHVRTTHERSFPCSRCPSRFKTRSDANRHNRIVHLKHKPFSCSLCKSVFAERGKLRRHTMTVHEKLRPHVCYQCGAAFGERGNLNQHLTSRHSNSTVTAEHSNNIVHVEHGEYPASIVLNQHSSSQTLPSTKVDL